MMTCSEAARLISEQKDHKLGLKDRLGLRMHLVMCRMCTAYQNKLDMISRFARQASEFVLGEQPSAITLSADAKDRMKSKLTSRD
jgi:hypothetical protein